MRGNPDAVASAYSLDDYRIADDLGGEAAYANLRDRAWARGIRLASDMVPNHMGIDSRWVIEHPSGSCRCREPPYPAYTFNGPDLSVGPARRDRPRGPLLGRQRRRGRLQAVRPRERRRALRLPRQRRHELPVERHRAARLPQPGRPRAGHPDDPRTSRGASRSSASTPRWSSPRSTSSACGGPSPGQGGGIPSRAEHAHAEGGVRRADAASSSGARSSTASPPRSPDTLLLAEAFWLLEGYFVRTLGMHRVYNSAFMHMLRDEDGAGYRQVIKDTIEFDPEILKRYVNFMSNPDEKTALEQFGKGDKYFGVATVMATLPGLPMLGHGQVQGFGEKYGMEFRRATLDERPDPWLVERHEREIFPLLHRRAWFAEARRVPAVRPRDATRGTVDENVLAYSNGSGPRALARRLPPPVRLDERLDPRIGAVRAPGRRRREASRAALAGRGPRPAERPGGVRRVPRRPDRPGVTALVPRDLGARPARLARGVREPRLLGVPRDPRRVRRPVGAPGRAARRARPSPRSRTPCASCSSSRSTRRCGPIFAGELVAAVLDGDATPAQLDELETRFATFLRAVAAATGVIGRRGVDRGGGPAAGDGRARRVGRAAGARATGQPCSPGSRWAGPASSHPAPTSRRPAGPGTTSCASPAPLAAGLHEAGFDEATAWAIADRVRVLLTLPRPSQIRGPVATADARLLERWLASDVVRTAIGVNTWEGVEWLDRDAFASMLAGPSASTPSAAVPRRRGAAPTCVARMTAAAESAGYDVARLRAALLPPARRSSPARARKARPGRPRT